MAKRRRRKTAAERRLAEQVHYLSEQLGYSQTGQRAAYKQVDDLTESMRAEIARLHKVIDGDAHDNRCNRHVGQTVPSEAIPVTAASCLNCRQNKAMADARMALDDARRATALVTERLDAMTLTDERAHNLAKLVVDRGWVGQAERLALVALREGKALTMLPPVPEQYAQAAEILMAMVNTPPTTRLSLAGADDKADVPQPRQSRR